MTVAICALFLGSGNTFAARSASHENHGITEQMQSVAVNVLVVDAQGEPIIGANVIEKVPPMVELQTSTEKSK